MEVKITYLRLLKLLSRELSHHTTMLALSAASGISNPPWCLRETAEGQLESTLSSLGMVRIEMQVPQHGVSSIHTLPGLPHSNVPAWRHLRDSPYLPSYTRAVSGTSQLYLQTGLGRQVYTWSSENSVSKLAAFLWKQIRCTICCCFLSLS